MWVVTKSTKKCDVRIKCGDAQRVEVTMIISSCCHCATMLSQELVSMALPWKSGLHILHTQAHTKHTVSVC